MTRKHTRRHHHPLVNPVELAIYRACKLGAEQRVDLIAPARHALETLAQGRGNVAVWQQFADVLNLAEALCELQIANNLASAVHQAQAALAALIGRVKAGRGWTLYGPEIAALREGAWLYGVQLGHCSAGEHLRAIEIVTNRIRGVLAGNASPRASVHQAPVEATEAAP